MSKPTLAQAAAPLLVSRDEGGGGDDLQPLFTGLSVAGGVLGAYHGYKRNNSVGWAVAWALLGSAFPLITTPIAFAQGFGKRS